MTEVSGLQRAPASVPEVSAAGDRSASGGSRHDGLRGRGTPRLVGPDVVRAIALIGVILMNYHGYLITSGGERADNLWGRFFDPWTGPLGTRFAATFVLTAGVGVTLFTRGAIGNRAAVAAKRWVLLRRGLLLYGFGLLFYEIWQGAILPYYGLMFCLGALLVTLPSVVVAATGLGAALAGAGIQWWSIEARWNGDSTNWLHNPPAGSPRGLLFDMFVNGTHPLFPWLAFFCAGILIGRVLRTDWWRPVAIALGATLWAFATLLSNVLTQTDRTPLTVELARDDPFGRGLLYTASALGTSLVAFTVIYTLATWFPASAPVRMFAHAGQMTLTLYVAHALVFNFVVHWMGWVRPAGLDLALVFALGYWVIAVALGAAWHHWFRIGPAEWLYRKLGG